jgi:hypothetical protein
LHPASAAHCWLADRFRTQAFLQRLSAFRATLSVVAAPDPGPFFCGFDNHGKQYNKKIRTCAFYVCASTQRGFGLVFLLGWQRGVHGGGLWTFAAAAPELQRANGGEDCQASGRPACFAESRDGAPAGCTFPDAAWPGLASTGCASAFGATGGMSA